MNIFGALSTPGSAPGNAPESAPGSAPESAPESAPKSAPGSAPGSYLFVRSGELPEMSTRRSGVHRDYGEVLKGQHGRIVL